MTAHHIKIFAPVEVQEPRGAAWAAAAAVSIGQGLRWLTRRLQGPRPAAPATELPRWQSKSARWAESRALTPALGDVAMSAGFVPGGRWAQLAAW